MYNAVVNERNQVVSHLFTQGVSADEIDPMIKGLHDRYISHGNMTETEVIDPVTNKVTDVIVKNQPTIAMDTCCAAVRQLKDAGFVKPNVIGDCFHIQDRIISQLTKTNKSLHAICCADLKKCFGSSEPGVFWTGSTIIDKLDKVEATHKKLNVWGPAASKTYEDEKKHINHCLNLPKVLGPVMLFSIMHDMRIFLHIKMYIYFFIWIRILRTIFMYIYIYKYIYLYL